MNDDNEKNTYNGENHDEIDFFAKRNKNSDDEFTSESVNNDFEVSGVSQKKETDDDFVTIMDEIMDNSEKHYYEETVKKPRYGTFVRVVASVLVLAVVSMTSFGVGQWYSSNRENRLGQWFDGSNGSGGTEVAESESAFEFKETEAKSINTQQTSLYSTKEIIKAASPSVVNISCIMQGRTSYFNNFEIPYSTSGSGSGIIFHEDDSKVYVVTNYHVINGASQISVSFDNDEHVVATVIAGDSQSDLAILSIQKSDLAADGVNSVVVATIGDSSELELGDLAIAIGNALGEGKIPTQGIISSTAKQINVNGTVLDVIQTDAAINFGNSGGALVNSKGEVIGINTAKMAELSQTSVEGMGYAIPSNTFKPIIEELMTKGYIARPALGIQGSSVTEELSDAYMIPIGALVREVIAGGGAAEAGIKAGDIIIEFKGVKIMSMNQLSDMVKECEVGETVSVRVVRDATKGMNFNVTLKNASSY